MAALAFRRLDEFQQEAGKFAWYWGGSLGLAVSAIEEKDLLQTRGW